jgi:erythromycin esterase
MRSNYLVLVALALPVASIGQNAPTQLFQQWARGHVHSIAAVDESVRDDSDLQPLRKIIGNAQMVALGEPVHGAHEPLAMRNRLIRYAVTQLGFAAVALETDLTSSQRLYNYVLGQSAETDSALKQAFTLDFGEYPENLELVRWLHAYNAAHPPARQVRLYGVDLSGQFYPYAYRSIEAVLSFLDRADQALGRDLRKEYADLIPVFRSDKYAILPPAQKDAITGKIQDLVALIRRERVPLIAASSADEYDWALRQALNAAQDDAFLRTLPPEFGDMEPFLNSPQKTQRNERWEHNHEMREVAMAENLEWVYQRESSRGKILFFAHDVHVQTSLAKFGSPKRPPTWPVQQSRMAGMFLRSVLDGNLLVIGTYFGHGLDFPTSEAPLPPDTMGIDMLLASLSRPQFIMDLRELPSSGPLHEWFKTTHETRGLASGNETRMVAPLEAYDAILFIDTITPTPAPEKR